jgi:hypothetical protein
MEKHLDKQSTLWAVGDLAQVKFLAEALPFLPLVPSVKPLVANVDAFAAGLVLDNDVTLLASLRGKDPAAANALYELFNRPASLQPKIGERDKAEPLWIMLQWRTDFDHAAEIVANPASLLSSK